MVACLYWMTCVHRYDALCDDDKDNFEGITKLVEHPIQMKPPGKPSHSVSVVQPALLHICEICSLLPNMLLVAFKLTWFSVHKFLLQFFVEIVVILYLQ